MNREEHNARMKMRRAEHREEYNARNRKWKSEHREEYNSGMRKRKAEHREEHNAYMRKYNAEDLNDNGVTKNRIRISSRRILEKSHAKLSGYQIHHCFGYEDANKFIYIPRSLHVQIHQLLRDSGIPSDTDHWLVIRDLVNSCEEYTYIRT